MDQNIEYYSTLVIHLYRFCSVFELENQLVTSGRPSPCPFWHLLCQCHSCGPCHINQCQLCVLVVISWLSSQKPNFEAIARTTLSDIFRQTKVVNSQAVNNHCNLTNFSAIFLVKLKGCPNSFLSKINPKLVICPKSDHTQSKPFFA